jgi:hypothetical protein
MVQFTPNLQTTLAGRMFSAMAGAAGTGITIPIYSATSGVSFALWNPYGSGRIIVPVSLQLGVAATATAAITTLALSQVINTGATYATGLPIAAWTDATVYNGRSKYGSSAAAGTNQGRIGVATTTLTTAGNSFYELGFSQATTALAPGLAWVEHDFNDKLVLDPGTLIHLVGNPLAPVETFVAGINWYEIDYVA